MAEQQTAFLSTAEARYVRVSPQKARLVVDMIRGQRAEDAINILNGTKRPVRSEAVRQKD